MTEPPRKKVAVITGASEGLGRALARQMTARGVHVVGIARRAEALAATAELCAPGLFTAWPGDVADPALMREIAARTEEDLGPVSILVNNAVIYERADFLNSLAEHACAHLQINCCGQINMTAAVLPFMVARGRGRIVNITSFAGETPLPGSLGYSVSKAATRAFTRALVAEVALRMPDIVVSEWIPGIMHTRSGYRDGICADHAAAWGAELALDDRPELHGTTFLRDRELLPHRSLRDRLKDALLLKPAPRPRMLAQNNPVLGQDTCS
ncbi:SDR family NAD(P)-dependent oxidoreductase [Paracoccus sp. T5]|uniref:SDR family NAD(P)-dependent oxidoreductase n=1 Tax=Paracoccus sp. T5 TaxID=3402161 RepID=UPI003AE9E931